MADELVIEVAATQDIDLAPTGPQIIELSVVSDQPELIAEVLPGPEFEVTVTDPPAIDVSVVSGALTVVELGIAGPSGVAGTNGTNGLDGKTVRSGSGAPSAGLGVDGDFYINTAANTIYGPKASGAWGSPTSLVGAAGAAGATGPIGPAGADSTVPGPIGLTGATGATGPAGNFGDLDGGAADSVFADFIDGGGA